MLCWNGWSAVVWGPLIGFLAGLPAPSFSAFNAIVAILLAAAVAVVTRLITSAQGRSAVTEGLFEHAPPVAMLSAEYRVVRVNREFTRLFGYEQREARGKLMSELIVPDESLGEFQRQAERAVQGHRGEAEAIRRRKDGSLVNVLAAAVPVPGPDGKLSIYLLHRDITERKTAEKALESLSRRLMEVQESERRHLARELHDEIGQLLTGLRLLLPVNGDLPGEELNGRLEQARAVVDDLLSRIREISFDLRPADLDHLGLLPALLALFERLAARTGVEINFKHQGIERRFSSQLETGAYRIVQEALTNAVRHARVTGVTVRIWVEMERLKLKIEDRGCGFDAQSAMRAPRSSGLTGMQERTALLGGRVSVESSPGRGTTIMAEFPLDGGLKPSTPGGS
jgi:PAS domain S-box-containing protein